MPLVQRKLSYTYKPQQTISDRAICEDATLMNRTFQTEHCMLKLYQFMQCY
ncbi:hypothetical protein [Nostoc sp. PCC 7107]|uniref:hypothetical protein n=1 Tax=Nostoc sp. PCC 7107 TaxID=317936 RepID=UPI0002D880F3|nr:hypothetical protein [Nostoc sp. PCC 7107]